LETRWSQGINLTKDEKFITKLNKKPRS